MSHDKLNNVIMEEQTIGGVAVLVPTSNTWYSGRSGQLGLYVRVEVEITSLYRMNLYIYSTNQTIFSDRKIENVTFALSLGNEAAKVFNLEFGPELMRAFAGTVVTSINGKWNSTENVVCLRIGIAYSWFSFFLSPTMRRVEEPIRSAR